MPFYSFHLSVPAPPDVVAERIRQVVSPAPASWASLTPARKFSNSHGTPFLGAVDQLSFLIRRNIQYRNSFLPMIRGKIVPTPTGSRVDGFMYVRPFSLVLMAISLGFLAYRESRLFNANPSLSFFPMAMILVAVALAVSLGKFYYEALKVMPLFSEAVFNSSIVTVPVPNVESQARAQATLAAAAATEKGTGLIAVALSILAAFILFYFYLGRLRASPAFSEGMNLLSNSVEARATLGYPIRAEMGVRGVAASGYAILKIPVSGPSGKGVLSAVANRNGDGWDVERAILHTGTPPKAIDLTPPTQAEPFHYPAMGHVYLLPLDSASASDIAALPDYYKARLGLGVALLSTHKLDPYAVNQNTNQVIAE